MNYHNYGPFNCLFSQAANMLFLESPRQVGFSYRDKNVDADNVYNDDKVRNSVCLLL